MRIVLHKPFAVIDAESYAFMNTWGLTSEFMQTLEDRFKEFFVNMGDKDYIVKSFARLIEDGAYQKDLFEDLK